MHFGEKIRQLREHYGLTQQQLADRVGVLQRSVSAWENNQYPPLDQIIKILASLNCSPPDFFGEPELSSDEAELLDLYKTLSERQKTALRAFLKTIASK